MINASPVVFSVTPKLRKNEIGFVRYVVRIARMIKKKFYQWRHDGKWPLSSAY